MTDNKTTKSSTNAKPKKDTTKNTAKSTTSAAGKGAGTARKVPETAFSPLYAVAGLTDLITTEVGHRLAKLQPAELQSLARRNADELLTQVAAQYATLVGRGRRRVDDVRKQADGLKGDAQGRLKDAYGSLVNAAKGGQAK